MAAQHEASSNSPTGDLEAMRLKLERDKHDLEVRKFEADQLKRELEARKLQEEVHEFQRPWYVKPAYVGPLSTVTIAIVGGLIAFGTDVFKSNVLTLRKDRDELTQSVSVLRQAQTKLSDEIRSTNQPHNCRRAA
jgi:hypothetical protein